MTWRWLAVAATVLAGCHSSVDLFGDDEPPVDAGTSDFTVPPSDGPSSCPGEAPKCYAGWDGTSDCCLTPGTNASCDGGDWLCPSGSFFEEDCDRLDPICEGPDGGPPGPLYDDCEVTSDCTLTGRFCCPACGRPGAEDVTAVNADLDEDYYFDVACPEARTDPPICPACPSEPNPYLTAICDVTGFRPACAVVDLTEPEFNGCVSDGDCMLAKPDCCFCGEVLPFDTIAVRWDVDLEALYCDGPVGCDCDPTFDPSLQAVCDASTGACVVVDIRVSP